ncbi:RNA-binding S4 domain-containing protein [Trueperella bialowiezensis]|uniref:Ribosome-associated protein n=1 Tax=Trueperella bialowiezensis TaxID=312285 RepID=A0A3S4UXX6_9ACTO|nr:RNA-binding S4 domain-containing protein [Trueperella bialowiezensis]VEI12589.1 ribosome-associated protein [Trueperella bialowiezensis]
MENYPVRLPIKLGQLLKLANFAESGAHARKLIESGEVTVNGQVETRRSHKLADGDVVSAGGYAVRVVEG